MAGKIGGIGMTIKAIVTDIEGTTSSIAFVHEVLFPYASRELPKFVLECINRPKITKLLDDVRAEAGEADASIERVTEILQQWIKEDRKATPLKALQGYVWRNGYENGDYTGHVYDDAADRLRQWANLDIQLYVYSSGSVDAQQLLFGFSDFGDLRPLFSGYFDTRIGHKRQVESYRAIVDSIDANAEEILFLSDIAEELDAAALAGMQTIQLFRQDDVVLGSHTVATNFDEVLLNENSRMSEYTNK